MHTAPRSPASATPALLNLALAAQSLRAANLRALRIARQRKLASSHFQRCNALLAGAR